MQMPQPTEHHAKLEQLTGTWRGEETLYPSPWAPELRTAVGKFSARIAVDGMFLISDYEEEREGAVVFRGHGVYGYDAGKGKYTMFWFDSMGYSPSETLGTWEGNTLTFENKGEHGRNRYVYEVVDADHYTFKILASQDGAEWSAMMEGRYGRV
jgi:hypothetical protein